jgi:hypothetical protein
VLYSLLKGKPQIKKKISSETLSTFTIIASISGPLLLITLFISQHIINPENEKKKKAKFNY